MARVALVAGNWKMNPGTEREARALAAAARDGAPTTIELVVAPPFVWLGAVRDVLAGGRVRVAAQDVHEEEGGAFTGGVSAAMLAEVAEMVIVGHSEVRRDRGDTDARVNGKLRRAFAAGVLPILCVGEPLEIRRGHEAEEFVRGQVRAALSGIGVADAARAVIAYEPIWAIGTAVPATGEDARDTIAAIRGELRSLYGQATAEVVRILYGGSVTSETIVEFASQPGIDGALVGGASQRADEFARIAQVVAETRA